MVSSLLFSTSSTFTVSAGPPSCDCSNRTTAECYGLLAQMAEGDQRRALEMLGEYFTNPEFRSATSHVELELIDGYMPTDQGADS